MMITVLVGAVNAGCQTITLGDSTEWPRVWSWVDASRETLDGNQSDSQATIAIATQRKVSLVVKAAQPVPRICCAESMPMNGSSRKGTHSVRQCFNVVSLKNRCESFSGG